MNISIITCSNANNYGAILQAFALSNYVISLGHNVQVIDYQPEYLKFTTKQWYNPRLDIKEWCKMLLRWQQRKLQISKYRRLRDFAEEFIPLTPSIYYSFEELNNSPPDSDLYIAGSDQIWNPILPNGSDPAFFLNFGSNKIKRISYAASFGVDKIPVNKQDILRKLISNIDIVSVREESAQKICNQLGFSSVLVCDPVFLHSSDFWIGIADNSFVPDKPYLLVYDLMKSKEIRCVAKKISEENNLQTISVSSYHHYYSSRNYGSCSPLQFLGLLLNAQTVICNSLHGCIFSIIFRKDFYVVDRQDGLNARIHNLLARYDLTNRLINKTNASIQTYDQIDYDPVYKILNNNTKRSKFWLCQQLNKTHFK